LDRHIFAKTTKISDFFTATCSGNVQSMPRARKHLVCVADTPYYHITSRCVRRAFLCGTDRFSGQSYEHRRAWIENRARVLSSLFSIHLCAYAVMTNHYHLVVKLNPDEANGWSDDEVLRRWTSLFRGPVLVQRYLAGEALIEVEQNTVASIVNVYRDRLANLSWFMKCLNEHIARQANAEDRCTGHFWEARFYSQALQSEAALLSAMAYVDLNPIRARMATTPESSHYTSIKARLLEDDTKTLLAQAISEMLDSGELNHFDSSIRPLMPFLDSCPDKDNGDNDEDDHERGTKVLPMREREYFMLVDHTGRAVSHNKRGRIDPKLRPILERIGLSGEQWLQASTAFKQHYRNGDLKIKRSA
jgi:REP element-mobilizing transposase RayT